MAHHVGNQITECKMGKRAIAQLTKNNIFECKVEKSMLDQSGDVLIAELKPDVVSNRLHKNKFGPAVTVSYTEVITVTVQAGEDVATKVMSFSGNGWAVYILSADGVVYNVTLRQGASFHKTTVYEGSFEILSLAGSYHPSETSGMSSRTGGLSVWLTGLDGCAFGGGVAGALTAASPVQVVIGRFPVEEKKKLKRTATGGVPDTSSSTARVL